MGALLGRQARQTWSWWSSHHQATGGWFMTLKTSGGIWESMSEEAGEGGVRNMIVLFEFWISRSVIVRSRARLK
jgi:hypothetical protein